MTRTDLELAAGTVRELTRDDLDALQDLFERCSDYFVLHDGRPPGPDAARDEWDAVPDGTPRTSKQVMGLHAGPSGPPSLCAQGGAAAATRAGALAGVVELVHDWPRAGTWNIGLLLLDPAARSRGAGAEIVAAVDRRAAEAGAGTLRISVNRANTRGMAFWRRLGFEPVPAVGADPAAIALERPVAR